MQPSALDELLENLSLGDRLEWKLVGTLVVIGVVLLLHILAQHLIKRNIQDVRRRYKWRKGASYATLVLVVLLLIPLWFEGFKSAATFLGLVSAGLAIALGQPVTNLAGWLFILWRRPFVVGDRIQIGEYQGDVIDLSSFRFTLLEIGNWTGGDQSTGRILHVPNGKIFTDVLANYTVGFEYIWDEIPVLITFESNWQRAKTILQEIADRQAAELTDDVAARIRKAAESFMIFYQTLTPTVYTSVMDSGVLLTIRYICLVRRRRAAEQSIWEDILREFAKHPDIDFAYPTQRFYTLDAESDVAPPRRSSPQSGPWNTAARTD